MRFFSRIGWQIWSARGIWVRAGLCWLIAISFRLIQETSDFDIRFNLRGTQSHLSNIVLIYVDQTDLDVGSIGYDRNLLRSLKEFSLLTDNLYWQPIWWMNLLNKVLQEDPKSIGVTFQFATQLRANETNPLMKTLTDPRILWSNQVDSEGRVSLSPFATTYGYNSATIDFPHDEDGAVRRANFPLSSSPSMSIRMAEAIGKLSLGRLEDLLGSSQLINFRGPTGTFTSISAYEVISGRFQKDLFKDKLVIIGSRQASGHIYQTPLGQMTRAELLANSIDNLVHERWIKRLNTWWSGFYVLLIVAIATLLMVTYPQSVALVFMLWLCTMLTALSLWAFDAFYFWIPISAALIGVASVYMIFLGYKLSLKENQTWKLEQERRISREVDQLKTNFVSLISHDLKTPIAKIQSICDRILNQENLAEDIKEGIGNLRQEGQSLHRYIHTILKISRLESSDVKLHKEASDLNEIVTEVCQTLTPLAQDKRQNLELALEPLFLVEIDGILIQEVILNLVENAIKYTQTGGHILVKTEEFDNSVIFFVKDNGPGVEKIERDKIFEKFFRGKAHQNQTKGTGLGLFLVKYFIELHGGKIIFESEFGKGVKVGFSLPLDEGTNV